MQESLDVSSSALTQASLFAYSYRADERLQTQAVSSAAGMLLIFEANGQHWFPDINADRELFASFSGFWAGLGAAQWIVYAATWLEKRSARS